MYGQTDIWGSIMYNWAITIKSISESIPKLVDQYWRDTRGATAIEYGLMSALIALLMMSGASALGGSINDVFTEVTELLSGPSEPPMAALDGG